MLCHVKLCHAVSICGKVLSIFGSFHDFHVSHVLYVPIHTKELLSELTITNLDHFMTRLVLSLIMRFHA